ncbi:MULTISPECIES: protein-export chaperone SecB [unclassified Shimia]|uniref:protein-export chaperone SecB n=1 Tax=unclassified Shimia TaxID=2630038 RepID=UPI001ADCEFBC|nr:MULTISPECIES: protein-export chaperone SecB [unclassified Shimia]MBO9473692.1 protein-export chaperone SecB [Shimia sp. R10_1]MDA5557362.1 protein-export chaperone SecB [Shimia sp. MMG029]
MAETENGAAQQAPQLKMNVLTQFVRDMSFENILAQKGSSANPQPDVQVQVNLDAKKRAADNQFEVAIKLNITAKNKDDGAEMFILEMDYAGVFHVEGVPEDQLHPFLLIECPRMLFPFVRRIVSDVTRDGGFPPLNLETIDFVALYRAELARRAQEQSEQPVAN